ncbi:MAG: PAS domain S-box protein [Methanomicrobiales archaeon]|nr:PAS domain S-box protein [Methanomicrobiales archaeon]
MPDTIKILYVDDEQALLDIGRIFLEGKGAFLVDTEPSALTALARMQDTRYDAIISDYQMPRMDGIGFLKAVRASGNDIPFILFTGKGREEIVIQALNEGADFYLQKGGEPESLFLELAHKVGLVVRQRRAEASVRNLERREADILNFLPDPTFAIDTQGIVIAWNRAMEDFTGVLATEILGKGNHEYAVAIYHERRPILIDLVLNNDPATEALYPFVLRSGKKLYSERFIPRKNQGNDVFIWFTASPIFDTSGRVAGAIESIRDITERKQFEEEILFKNLVLSTEEETAPDAFLIVDDTGKIIHYNKKFVELWQIPEDLLASRIDEPVLLHVVGKTREPEQFLYRVRYLYDHPHEKSYEEIQLCDGRTVERQSSPMFGLTGKFYGRVWYFRDITERKRYESDLEQKNKELVAAWHEIADREQQLKKQLEELDLSRKELAEREALYRSIAETANEGLWSMDARFITTYVNRKMASLLGYTPEEMKGRLINEFMDPGEHADNDKKMQDRREGKTQTYTRNFRHRDGSVRRLQVTATPLQDMAGNFCGSFARVSEIP